MFGGSQFGAEPRCMLEDTFGAGVMDKLITTDKAFLHLDPAPGAEPVREVCQGSADGYRHGAIVSEGCKPCQPSRTRWLQLRKV